ncbi:unnamed protein product [Cylindrotheca closterium]|uniref:Uncharacterized protein n=1 Tax=Cylindrotheca closterium TaxID=2856 RepID=A0AAD2CIC8_9STRA|nr:unnamed protein product [Cylindrotheca closterium]
MMMSQSNDTTSPSRSSSLSSLDRETSTTSSVSAPIEIQCVDPVIASIFQPGFASNYDHEDHINNSEHDHHIWLHQGEKENGLPDNIEYVIMDEPGEEIPTITRKRSRVSFLHRPHLATNAKNCHHPTSTTDTSPKVVQLSEHGTHYGKAQILAWRTQRASKAALRKALQLPKKHSPRAKAVALKSVEVVKEVSIKSVELALKHSPINCHHNNNNNSSNNNNSNKTKL